jgi:hypothetical protein
MVTQVLELGPDHVVHGTMTFSPSLELYVRTRPYPKSTLTMKHKVSQSTTTYH